MTEGRSTGPSFAHHTQSFILMYILPSDPSGLRTEHKILPSLACFASSPQAKGYLGSLELLLSLALYFTPGALPVLLQGDV